MKRRDKRTLREFLCDAGKHTHASKYAAKNCTACGSDARIDVEIKFRDKK